MSSNQYFFWPQIFVLLLHINLFYCYRGDCNKETAVAGSGSVRIHEVDEKLLSDHRKGVSVHKICPRFFYPKGRFTFVKKNCGGFEFSPPTASGLWFPTMRKKLDTRFPAVSFPSRIDYIGIWIPISWKHSICCFWIEFLTLFGLNPFL